MALMITAEVKSILGITDSTYDAQIAFFIPYVAFSNYLPQIIHDGLILIVYIIATLMMLVFATVIVIAIAFAIYLFGQYLIKIYCNR